MLFHELKRERVVPGRHRRVRREDRASADLVEGVIERRARSVSSRMRCSTTNAGVAFVEVEDRRIDARAP